MNPRCHSVFQNYLDFEAWQDGAEHLGVNLLQRLNVNLYNYENNYKKYMNSQQNQLKLSRKLQVLLPPIEKNAQTLIILPTIKPDPQIIEPSQNLSTHKVFISDQKQLKDSDIFCQRTNLLLKNKTLCFEKCFKTRFSTNKRKMSLFDQKYPQIQKILNQPKMQKKEQEKQNINSSIDKLTHLPKPQSYKKLRFRLKKAANKSKLFHEQKIQEPKNKENQKNTITKIRLKRVNQSILQDIDDNSVEQKINEFSDKKFYQSNIKDRFRLHR